MRILLFGSGSPQSVVAFERLAERHDLAAVVVPAVRLTLRGVRIWRRQRRATAALRAAAARLGIRVLPFRKDAQGELAARAAALRCELICVASFPYRLSPEVLAAATRGALNVHTSLLPRHRGADPIFATYMSGDADAGVTIHWMDAQLDTGAIAAQRAIPLARGRASLELYRELNEIGVSLLLDVIDRVARGETLRLEQHAIEDDAAPRFIDPRSWTVDRAWHALAGLSDRFDMLIDGVRHGRPLRRTAAIDQPAGTIVRNESSLTVYCADGAIELELPRAARRA